VTSPSDTPSEAVTVPATKADAAADFENFIFGEEDEEQDDSPPESDEEQDLELDGEETGETEDEPEDPAIAPPASLTAEEKAAFAQLPKEAQAAWAASENRRNTQVQEATTKASQAQREAEARAAHADAEAKSLYAQQLDQFVKAFEPQAPDPNLAYQDPARYIAEKAQYDAQKAQHDNLVQQVRGIATEADTQAQQAFIAQRDRELMQIPEIANPETRETTIQRAFGEAEKLGFDVSELAQGAQARDIKALLEIAELREKASKYDAAMSRKMQRVRSAKGKTLRPNAAPQEQSRAATAAKAWERTVGTRNKQAQADAFADYLEATGNL
jgi:hypothetical protein